MGSYSVTRTTTVDAPAHEVHALIDDFHAWTQWSPWEDLDPELQRTYSGSERGVGAVYQWSGNRKADQGRMEIRSIPHFPPGSFRESAAEALAANAFLRSW